MRTDRPYRVLHVVARLGRGGAETMLMNYYRHIDRDLLQFDFLVNYPDEGEYEKEVLALGGRIYRTIPIRPWRYHTYFSLLDKFFASHHDYVAVHAHIQDNSGFVLKYAARHGVACRIAHSHLAKLPFDIKYPFYMYGRRLVKRYVTHRMACGEAAGRFMFGGAPFDILHNSIDLSLFAPDAGTRARARAELSIGQDALVCGHVGRFFAQKNHAKLLQIFAEVRKRRPDAVLLMIGTGEKMEEMRRLAKALGLDGSARFLGSRPDVPRLLQAMDVFVFPSLYEGLPVSVIEAQAAGLPCVISDTIDADTAVTPLVRFVPLGADPAEWARAALEAGGSPRADTTADIAAAGYDVRANAQFLTRYYLDAQKSYIL